MSWFITGTDTGAGKTFITSALLHAFAAAGLRAVAMKPLAAGVIEKDGLRINEDVACLQAAMGAHAPPLSVINPYALSDPTAPHIAAARAGVRLALGPIATAYRDARRLAEVVLVEGVGGWCLPLNESEWLSDIPRSLDLPVLLVAGIRLGGLNHTLLTARAVAADGCRLDGWIANLLDPEYAYATETIDTLATHLGCPPLAVVAWSSQSDPRVAGAMLQGAARTLATRRTGT